MDNEVLIPACLSQENYPVSFRYYDAILKIVKVNLSHTKKGYYTIK